MTNKILNKKQVLEKIDASLKRAKLIERICRNICNQQNINSEKLVCKMMPELINYPYMAGFFLPNPQYTMPAWMLYIDVVKMALDAIESQK